MRKKIEFDIVDQLRDKCLRAVEGLHKILAKTNEKHTRAECYKTLRRMEGKH